MTYLGPACLVLLRKSQTPWQRRHHLLSWCASKPPILIRKFGLKHVCVPSWRPKTFEFESMRALRPPLPLVAADCTRTLLRERIAAAQRRSSWREQGVVLPCPRCCRAVRESKSSWFAWPSSAASSRPTIPHMFDALSPVPYLSLCAGSTSVPAGQFCQAPTPTLGLLSLSL